MAANKYHNQPTFFCGLLFDSKAEGLRYTQLLPQAEAGQITNLTRQPKYLLQAGFRDATGKWHRAIYYIGDFAYLDSDGMQVVEDVKGVETAVFRLKRKLLQAKYPEVQFRVLTYGDVLGPRRGRRRGR